MVKRSYSSVSPDIADYRANMYQAFKRKKTKTYPKPNGKSSLLRQVKALVAGKRKDAADVNRTSAAITATTSSCLTSSTDFAVAASASGILDFDGDSCLINNIKLRGTLMNAGLEGAKTGIGSAYLRHLVVFFNKPLLVASAAGTLPPVTEVLVSDDIRSLYVTDTANAGRFTVLSDKTWDMGRNLFTAAGGISSDEGNNSRMINYTINVNKRIHFAANAVSGTPAGHYDSDVASGRVDKGLIVLYTISTQGGQAGTLQSNYNCRLNYTG